jgi:hypothetical protein
MIVLFMMVGVETMEINRGFSKTFAAGFVGKLVGIEWEEKQN